MWSKRVELGHWVLDTRQPQDLALLPVALGLAALLAPAGQALNAQTEKVEVPVRLFLRLTGPHPHIDGLGWGRGTGVGSQEGGGGWVVNPGAASPLLVFNLLGPLLGNLWGRRESVR